MPSSYDTRSTADDVLRGRMLRGKTLLVTGSGAGIGFETARAFAAYGARVIVCGRTQERAEQTAARIRAQTNDAELVAAGIELGSFASIRRAVDTLRLDRLDALICNAGLYANSYTETEDGIERTVGVCHFGHFLLTMLLLPALRAAAPARVVVVSSESHRYPARLDFARFPMRSTKYRPLIAYGQAKLCNVLFANELTRRRAADGIYANSLHPGSMIGTSIFRESLPAKLIATVARPFTKNIAQGAATTVYCAVADELERSGGHYFKDCREAPMSEGARDAAAAAELWRISEARVGGAPSRSANLSPSGAEEHV